MLTGHFFSHNCRRYKGEFEEQNHSYRLTSRSVRSDVHFAEDRKEKKVRTGSYEFNTPPMYESVDPEFRRSGDYDYPDPQPAGTKETFYDNPGLQQETAQ